MKSKYCGGGGAGGCFEKERERGGGNGRNIPHPHPPSLPASSLIARLARRYTGPISGGIDLLRFRLPRSSRWVVGGSL